MIILLRIEPDDAGHCYTCEFSMMALPPLESSIIIDDWWFEVKHFVYRVVRGRWIYVIEIEKDLDVHSDPFNAEDAVKLGFQIDKTL